MIDRVEGGRWDGFQEGNVSDEIGKGNVTTLEDLLRTTKYRLSGKLRF